MGIVDKQQKRIWFISLFGLQLALQACSSVHQNSDVQGDSPASLKRQILELQKVQSQQTAQIEDLNNKITMLSGHGAPPKELVQPAQQLSATPIPKVISQAPLTSVRPLTPVLPPPSIQAPKPSHDPAVKAYDQVVLDCKKAKLDDAQKSVAAMIKQFKDSPLTSNALYLYADTLFEHGQYAKSADEFEKLYKLYPDGNKAVSALYKLAVCYQRLGHPAEAQQAFENIVTLYPGSREALDSEKQVMNGGQEPGS